MRETCKTEYSQLHILESMAKWNPLENMAILMDLCILLLPEGIKSHTADICTMHFLQPSLWSHVRNYYAFVF